MRSIHGAFTAALLAVAVFSPAGCDGCNGGGSDGGNGGTDGSTPCPEGTLNCPCRASNLCDDGLTCANNACVTVTADGVVVGNSLVRSCDLLLNIGTTTVADVSFDSTVIGRFRTKPQRLALAFTARGDSALGGVADLIGADGQPIALSAITVEQATCYDRLGAAVADPAIQLR